MSFGLSGYVPIVLYAGGIVALLLSIFWRPVVGIFYLLPLIPLQTVRYSMNGFPLATSVIPIMLLGITIGLLRQGESVLPKSPMRTVLLIYGFYTWCSLVYGAYTLHDPFPLPSHPRFGVWEDYMDMPALLLLVAAIKPTKKQIQALVLLMCVATLALDRASWSAVSGRDFSQYSEDIRAGGGAMGYAGVNGLAAFEAMFSTFLLALSCYARHWWLKLGYIALSVFGALCMMYTFSRGAYIAFLVGWLFIGLFKNRVLLIPLIIFVVSWTAFVPAAVQQRVDMTYDADTGDVDHSAEMRVLIWQDAIELIASTDVVFGMGFDTYAYLHRVGTYESTHNILLAVLVETGLVGLIFFLWIAAKLFWTSLRVSWISDDPLIASIALGVAGSVLCSLVASLFGDRWMYFQVNGYMWLFAGVVMAEWMRLHAQEDSVEEDDEQLLPAPAAASQQV